MAKEIPTGHPLRRLFEELVDRRLARELSLSDPPLTHYIAELLSRFAHVDELYRIRDTSGRPLDDVGEMLLESDPRRRASSFVREREVRRHIGDFTLFFLGLFPQWVRSHATSRLPDVYVDWARTGRESYDIVASFTVPPFAAEAPLFRRLSEQYELCVIGLNKLADDLRRLPDRRIQDIFDQF